MNITTILVLFAGYLASFIPPLAWLCIAAAVKNTSGLWPFKRPGRIL